MNGIWWTALTFIPCLLAFSTVPFHSQPWTLTSLSVRSFPLFLSSSSLSSSSKFQITQLPDSLDDSAILAAEGCLTFYNDAGPMNKCRVDFDTSIGDETYTTLKSSTQFMQKFVTALCYEMIPGVKEMREQEKMNLIQAKVELKQLLSEEGMTEEDLEEGGTTTTTTSSDAGGADAVNDATTTVSVSTSKLDRMKQLQRIIQYGGRNYDNHTSGDENDKAIKTKNKSNPPSTLWDGPKARIYFPDEGSAALARRDWCPTALNPEEAKVPPCVEFSSCGGVQSQNIERDTLIFFFCPKASEAEYVEKILARSEEILQDRLKLTVFVNPLLVDMGVTGFGMAGRMLRERLIDQLAPVYYLRTLPWGALTRLYPRQFTVWQEDENMDDGYRMIKSMDRLPSNPEVEDIYDYENGISNDPDKAKGFGLLNAIGDFVNGMTRL